MSDLYVHANTVSGQVKIAARIVGPSEVRTKTLAMLSPEEAEELAFDLLSACYLVREHKKTRMRPGLKDEFKELLEGVSDR